MLKSNVTKMRGTFSGPKFYDKSKDTYLGEACPDYSQEHNPYKDFPKTCKRCHAFRGKGEIACKNK